MLRHQQPGRRQERRRGSLCTYQARQGRSQARSSKKNGRSGKRCGRAGTGMEGASAAWGIIVNYVAPVIGVVVANAMFSSPLAAVLRVRKSRALGELNPLPYPVIFCNCICWLVYAMLTNDWFLYFGNLPGMLLGIFFVMSTIRLAPDEVRTYMEIFQLVLLFEVFAVAGGLALGGASMDAIEFVWGLNCNIILLIYYGAPLSMIVKVVRTKSSSALHFPMVLANFVNGSMWFMYGLWGLNDYWLWGVNGMGAILAAFQLILLAAFPRRKEAVALDAAVPEPTAEESLTPLAAAGGSTNSLQSQESPPSVSV
eukprot:jgi/Tetstr1/462817/TSEL_007767.t1